LRSRPPAPGGQSHVRRNGAPQHSVWHPITEQEQIVLHIDSETAKIDALISRIRECIEKLKEYSAALISAAVTGKIDVRDEITSQDDVGI